MALAELYEDISDEKIKKMAALFIKTLNKPSSASDSKSSRISSPVCSAVDSKDDQKPRKRSLISV